MESDCDLLALNAEDTLKAGPAQDESEEADAHGLTPGAWIQARMCWRRSPRPGMPTSRHVLGKQAPSPLLSLTWGHLRDMSTYHRLSGLLHCMCAPRPLPPGGIDHGSFLKPASFLWHLCHWVVQCSLGWSKRDTSGLQMRDAGKVRFLNAPILLGGLLVPCVLLSSLSAIVLIAFGFCSCVFCPVD